MHLIATIFSLKTALGVFFSLEPTAAVGLCGPVLVIIFLLCFPKISVWYDEREVVVLAPTSLRYNLGHNSLGSCLAVSIFYPARASLTCSAWSLWSRWTICNFSKSLCATRLSSFRALFWLIHPCPRNQFHFLLHQNGRMRFFPNGFPIVPLQVSLANS